MVNLVKLSSGKSARIVSIEGGSNLITKLQNLGLKEAMEIKKITGASGRGPVVVKSGRTQIAIGVGMASKIMVEPI
jgi:Fe2+ transport system protein FeoA